jgi:hypothetical protein
MACLTLYTPSVLSLVSSLVIPPLSCEPMPMTKSRPLPPPWAGLEGTGVPAYRHLLFSRYRTGQFWGVPVREIACSRTFHFQLFWRVFGCFWYILSTQAVTVLGKLKPNFFLLHVASRPEAQLQVHHNTHSRYSLRSIIRPPVSPPLAAGLKREPDYQVSF